MSHRQIYFVSLIIQPSVVFVKSLLQIISKISCKFILTTTIRCIIVNTTNEVVTFVVKLRQPGVCGVGSLEVTV